MTLRWVLLAGGLGAALASADAAVLSDGQVLRDRLVRDYPSLRYVERYRAAFPAESQPGTAVWSGATLPAITGAPALVRALVVLQDQHVAIVGPKAGKAETLGVLFRSSADGGLVAWRVFDRASAAAALAPRDRVLSIDGVPAKAWLDKAARLTFGGNRRGRMAEAALDLGLGTPLVHRTAGLGARVRLRVQGGDHAARTVTLAYRPVDEALATALSAAVGERDLPTTFVAGSLRVGTLRLGAFAPQYDPVFIKASDAAASVAGTSEEQAMLTGYCAVVDRFLAEFDAVAATADVVVLDLRGNMGGFDREARLLADAMMGDTLPRTFDFAASPTPGTVALVEERTDPSCGRVGLARPLVVFTDGGTRSAGEFMTAWLWAAGATVVGERGMGAGGGYEYQGASSIALPASGYAVRTSAVFSVFDPVGALAAGPRAEAGLLDPVTGDGFRPSRTRPFMIQSVGFTPDLVSSPMQHDLQDGGLAQLKAALGALSSQGRLTPPGPGQR